MKAITQFKIYDYIDKTYSDIPSKIKYLENISWLYDNTNIIKRKIKELEEYKQGVEKKETIRQLKRVIKILS